MVIDFRSRPPFGAFASGTALFPRKTDLDFDNPMLVPALSKNSGKMESARKCDMGLYFEEMAEAGIDLCVVHGRQTKTEGYVPNEDIASLLDKYPDRFIGFGALDLDCQEQGRRERIKKEIRRCKAWGFKGISLEPGYCLDPMYFDDERLEVVYETCLEEKMLVSLTSSIFVGPDMSYTDPVRIQRVANRYPELTIAVDHGCWPYVAGILGAAMVCPNLYLYPDFYGYMPDMPFGGEFVKAANSYLEYRFLFGSGYPIRSMIQAVRQFCSQPFRPEIMENLMCNNAKRLLGLDEALN